MKLAQFDLTKMSAILLKMSKLKQALELLKEQYEASSGVKKLRLETIVEKLQRVIDGDYDHKDDLTDQEKYENEVETMTKYIVEEWGNCEDLRMKIGNEGLGYFYNSYAEVPVSFEVYEEFASSEICWCGNCEDSSDVVRWFN